MDKNFEAQKLIKIITDVDKDLIKSIRVFDVYEGENIDKDKSHCIKDNNSIIQEITYR